MKIIVKAVSDKGCKRKQNEDILLAGSDLIRDDAIDKEYVLDDKKDLILFAVSDGMGGHSAGDVASMTVLRELAVAMNGLGKELEKNELIEYFTAVVKEIHNGLVEQAQKDPSKKGMGATLVGILIYEGKFYILNAGDSRIYRFRRGILKQLSQDHSLAEAAGLDRNSSHVLLNSIGGGEDVFLDFIDVTDKVMNDDLFLLCSDGLTDLVDDETIEDIIDANPEPSLLVGEAKKNGGDDNITVILAEIKLTEKEAEPKNEFLELLDSEKNGLDKIDNYEAEKFIRDNHLEPVRVHGVKNIAGDDATITVYEKENLKIVVSTVEHETHSEGTLHYTSSYGNIKLTEEP